MKIDYKIFWKSLCVFLVYLRAYGHMSTWMLGTGIRRMNKGPMGHIAQKRIFRYSRFSARECVKFFEICL